jgi:hypothetical protein
MYTHPDSAASLHRDRRRDIRADIGSNYPCHHRAIARR